MTEDQATQLASTLANVFTNFVLRPHQTVEELDLSANTTRTETPPEKPQVQVPQLWESNEQLRMIIGECVRETIQQMFQSGALVGYGSQKTGGTMEPIINSTLQTVQPMIDYSLMSDPPAGAGVIIQKPQHAAPVKASNSPLSDLLEDKLRLVWSELLDISQDSIGNNDSFFQLGGDSIIAMQMVGIARDEDLALTVANIFRHPTFADMVEVIRLATHEILPLSFENQEGYDASRTVQAQMLQNALYQRFSLLDNFDVDALLRESIGPKVRSFKGGIVDVFPVTDFQALAVTGSLMESKWMLNYFYLEGDGRLDLKKLKHSVSRLVDAFDILRTVFVSHGNRFFQVVLKRLQPEFAVHETGDLAAFTRSLQQNGRVRGPLLGESYLQITVAKQRDSHRHRIIIRMSHAQYDGVCMPKIFAALQAGYLGHSIPPTPSFSTYVREAARRTTDDHYAYWKALLKGSSMTEVVRRSGPNYSRGRDEPTSLKRIIHLNSLVSQNITPATVIKASWAFVLAHISSRSDIIFGNVISGRNSPVVSVESIIGPCVNLVPVRIQLQSSWTVMDLLRHIQDQQVANMPYESLGFREIIKHCTDWPDWSNFSTVCQHQNIQRNSQMELGGNQYTIGAVGSQEDFADLTVLSTPQDNDQIELNLIFTSNSGIDRAFADEAFDMLCSISSQFSTSPAMALPSTTALAKMQPQVPEPTEAPPNPTLAPAVQALSPDELLRHLDVLTQAWRQILSDGSKTMAAVGMETSFFDLGGDIVGLAQVAALLELDDFAVRVEDLVDHPLFSEQLALLALAKSRQLEAELLEVAEDERPEEEAQESVRHGRGLKKLLAKSVGVVKKMRRPKGDDRAEEGESAVQN